ncbi:MAG: helix-turn-helix domain-containing protein [Lachnospiraceae bacterium]|nr:helix-turn-helix domain-containing protein [Lachnospiraceae bacterium]
MDELYTVEQAAIYLKVSTKTIRRLIKNEKIIASKVGGRWRIKKSDIEGYLGQTSNIVEVPL